MFERSVKDPSICTARVIGGTIWDTDANDLSKE